MDRFFGFDLGDAESAIARLYKEDQVVPEMIPVAGEKSFITAYAQLTSGELLIGEKEVIYTVFLTDSDWSCSTCLNLFVTTAD